MFTLQKMMDITFVKVMFLAFLGFSGATVNGQNQNCADVDFSFEINGQTLSVTGESKDNISQWHWHFGNGVTQTGKNATIMFDKAGVFEICLKVVAVTPVATSDALCTGVICKRVTIGTVADDDCALHADFEFSTDGIVIKARGKSSDSGAQYLWTISGQNVQKSGQDVVFNVDKPGIYELCMIVAKNDQTCKVRICKKVEIKATCNIEADFAFDYVDGVYRFTAKSNVIATSVTGLIYHWDFGDGNTAIGQAVKHIYTNDGIFNVCLTVRDSRTGCTLKVCKLINSDEGCNLKADFKFTVSGNGVIFNARSTNDDVKYYWDFGNNTRGEGQNVRAVYQSRGVFVVCLTVVDEKNNCKVQVCKRVLIGRPTLGPDGNDGTISGIKNVVLYPNPATSVVHVQSRSLKITNVVVYNFQQVEVINRSTNNLLIALDVTSLPEGIYTVHVVLEDGTTQVLRFYKQ